MSAFCPYLAIKDYKLQIELNPFLRKLLLAVMFLTPAIGSKLKHYALPSLIQNKKLLSLGNLEFGHPLEVSGALTFAGEEEVW